MLEDKTLTTPSTLAQMRYLKAWVLETLRPYPFIAIPREPAEDLALSRHIIPGGIVHVTFLIFSIGREEEVLENNEKFKPERWQRRKDYVLTEAAEGFSSIPFGFETGMSRTSYC